MGMVRAFLVEISDDPRNLLQPPGQTIVITTKKHATAHDAIRALAKEEGIGLNKIVGGGANNASGSLSGTNDSIRATLVRIITF